jgi:hypothetical protein
MRPGLFWIQRHSGRLDQVFMLLGQRPQAVRCPAIDGLIGELRRSAAEGRQKSELYQPMLKKLKPGSADRLCKSPAGRSVL